MCFRWESPSFKPEEDFAVVWLALYCYYVNIVTTTNDDQDEVSYVFIVYKPTNKKTIHLMETYNGRLWTLRH